jgi:hypothetical protein
MRPVSIDTLLTITGRTWFAKYYDSAVAIPSPEFHLLQNIAKKNKVFLSVGIIEKEGGTLYCVSLLLGKDGSLLGRHRKVRSPKLLGKIFHLLKKNAPACSYWSRTSSLGSRIRRVAQGC